MTPTGPRRIIDDDDLLNGFDESGPTHGQFRGFFATLILTSLWAWEVAFEYGTHHVVFYHAKMRFFALSTALLLGALILRRRIRVHAWVQVVLALPILIVLLRLIVPVQPSGSPWPHLATDAGPIVRIVEGALLAATVLASPAALWVILRLVAPEYFTLPGRRVKAALVLVVAIVAGLGFLVGRFNNQILTCEEFIVAGDDPPRNCAHSR